MEVIEDSLTLILTHTVSDSDVRSAAISQANIDQDWLPAHHQINHVHWSNTMGRMCVYIGEYLLLQAVKNMILQVKTRENQCWFTRLQFSSSADKKKKRKENMLH